MRTKACKKEMIKRLIAVGLMLASFAMLFLPWVKISLKVLGRRISVPRFVDTVADYADYFGFDLRGALYDAADAAGARGLLDAAEPLLSGSLTPLETVRAGELLGRSFGSLRYMYTGTAGDIALSGLAEIGNRMAAASGMIRAGLWAMCALLALSVVLVLCGKRFGALPYLIGAFGMLVIFSVLIHGFNSGIRSIINNYSYLLVDELSRIGVGVATLLGVRIFHIGPAALICLLFAAAAFVLALIRFRADEPRRVPAPVMAAPAMAAPVMRSAPRNYAVPAPPSVQVQPRPPAAQSPGANYCVRCGSALRPGASFCTNCGAKVS